MNIYEQLHRDEGVRQSGYQINGRWTIGVGHDIESGPPIPLDAVEMILYRDVAEKLQGLTFKLPWIKTLNDARRGALINLSFNMGVDGLIDNNPRMIHAMQLGQWSVAAQELLDGPYKDQVGDRAYRLAKQIETGEWV